MAIITTCKSSAQDYKVARDELVNELRSQGIHSQRVLEAIRTVDRHRFVPESLRNQAYRNYALPIGEEQTISQPYVVAYMTELLQLEPTDKVLEIGTGSGYQAAILAELVEEVYSIEIIEVLAERATGLLTELGYQNIHVRVGDGYQGWPDLAPFDAIIVTAAPGHIPQPLIDQLGINGRLVLPVGDDNQRLTVVIRNEAGVATNYDLPVLFVPMTGEAQRR